MFAWNFILASVLIALASADFKFAKTITSNMVLQSAPQQAMYKLSNDLPVPSFLHFLTIIMHQQLHMLGFGASVILELRCPCLWTGEMPYLLF